MLEVTQKLYKLIEESILLPKKGGERISSLGSETAADIKTLAATVLDLVEQSSNIPSTRRNLFTGEDDDNQIKRALTGTNTFGCKIPDLVEKRLKSIDTALSELKATFANPGKGFTFNIPQSRKANTPSYALAASKHAPHTSPPAIPTVFRPVLARKQPPPPHQHSHPPIRSHWSKMTKKTRC